MEGSLLLGLGTIESEPVENAPGESNEGLHHYFAQGGRTLAG